jgi:hypothetical protein
MASYGPAVNRIKYLINGRHSGYQATPATISGGPESIYSYRLRIAWKDGDDWTVHESNSTPTTNRHIRACHMAMEELGFTADQNYPDRYKTLTRYVKR